MNKSLTVHQRTTISFREIARVAFKTYPKRSILCLSLFVGQAFLYNGVTFNLGTLMSTFFGVGAAVVPVFLIIYAIGNFAGPVLLGRLFDTVGRKPMISGTYLGSAALSIVLAGLFYFGTLNSVTFIIVVVAVFFLASSGASAAYLTASEIFPMETRALAIAFFYAIGTGVGGIIGPLLFGKLIATGDKGPVAIAFLIGAVVMAIGGLVELAFGVKAAGEQLEDIAEPLTAGDEPGSDSSSVAPGPRVDGHQDDDNADESADADGLAEESRQQEAERTANALREARLARERTGLRRYRPGPGHVSASPGMAVTAPLPYQPLDLEIQAIERALEENGATEQRQLAQMVGARYWGPGVFRAALREARVSGTVVRISRSTFALRNND